MPAEKRNNFLDAEDSDDDVRGYESEEEVRKGSTKRRRIDDDDASSDDENDAASIGDEESDEEESERKPKRNSQKTEPEEEEEEESALSSRKKQKLDELPGISKPLTKKNLVATEAAIKKSGVVYISRVPPFMKPQKLRSLLEPYGTINRIFLSPEDPAEHSRRVKNGGNKKRSFTDGWVEFVKKKDAKAAVDLLRGQVIGGKKGSFYRDDLWSLSYLKGFKWHNLTEQISAEAAEKSNRMRAEISKSTKENKEFVQNVEKAKMLNGIQSKKKQREGGGHAVDQQSRRTFEQSAVAKKPASEKLSEGSKRVASMLF
ncbi:Pre-rRNA-processing protein ESF2 [Pestalotiopsis fici W106-1]|uniref:18S rRNA factor 2 n=1 Tax=Pestalotiopsis fici (strain W106-1 / CGMCC3.15140) TaxID=1229662 RepID=W3WPS1_PESFW|nr:Pre-rRNA-processing protein ESF2 [Pestalotiopsis fici W106-1]ETS75895.1 Pre-rRNA-processing protein ESF2 [Pestalotiopsis fici W106-1]